MKKLFIAISLALSLSACASIQNTFSKIETGIQSIVTTDNLDTLEAAYGAVLAQAVAYRDLCQKKIINKSCWNVIAKVQPYQLKAQNAVLTLRAFVRNNPNADASSLVQLAKSALMALKDVVPALPTTIN